MFFRIARHAERELLLCRIFHGRSVVEQSVIEVHHLSYQVGRMLVSAFRWLEAAVFLSLVSAQQQHVADTEKLQVDEFVFHILGSSATAYHVWHNGNTISLLYGRCYGRCSGAAAHTRAFQQAVFALLIYVFAMVRSDIYVERVEHFQFVNRAEQSFRTVAFQWRQHLKRKVSFPVIVI